MKLDHIAIIASDYQKALAFYGILGFQEIERVKRPFDIMGMLECDGVWIELFEKKTAPARPSEPEALGLRHIAFVVGDLDGRLAQLHQSGIETEPVRTDLHGRRFTFFKDPDGLPIEIKEELPKKE